MKKYCYTFLFLVLYNYTYGQRDTSANQIIDIDYAKRKKSILYGIGSTYIVGSASLYFAWYKQNPQSNFHFFDDSREWLMMDKLGHVFSAYNQVLVLNKGLKWSGYSDDRALLYSSLMSIGFQTTIEVMDGFSTKWGFSNSDFIANVVGTSAYYIQEKVWSEQRLRLKMSYWPINYPSDRILSETEQSYARLDQRANTLFGSGVESFLKDYNGQTIWLSINVSSFLKNSPWPKWLSLAIGYSGANMYGGFNNEWRINNDNIILDPSIYPRYRQFVFSLDYNLETVRSRSPFVNTLLDLLNLLKWPAPAIEYNQVEGFQFRLLFYN